MKPSAWLATGDDGREVAISEHDLRLQRPDVQEMWKDAEPLFRAEPKNPERRRWNVLTYDYEIRSYTPESVNVNWEQMKAVLRRLREVGYSGAHDADVIVERVET